MIKSISTLLMASIVLLPFNSCKKHGCTDVEAANYSNVAKKDDGSCILASAVEPKQVVFEEQFSMTFGPSVAYNIHNVSFNYEPGDVIIIENLTDPTYNYWSAMPIVTNGVVVWSEYGYDNGEIWVYADDANTGNDYFFSSSVNFGFRAMLIKKSALILNPDLEKMSIEEVKAIL